MDKKIFLSYLLIGYALPSFSFPGTSFAFEDQDLYESSPKVKKEGSLLAKRKRSNIKRYEDEHLEESSFENKKGKFSKKISKSKSKKKKRKQAVLQEQENPLETALKYQLQTQFNVVLDDLKTKQKLEKKISRYLRRFKDSIMHKIDSNILSNSFEDKVLDRQAPKPDSETLSQIIQGAQNEPITQSDNQSGKMLRKLTRFDRLENNGEPQSDDEDTSVHKRKRLVVHDEPEENKEHKSAEIEKKEEVKNENFSALPVESEIVLEKSDEKKLNTKKK